MIQNMLSNLNLSFCGELVAVVSGIAYLCLISRENPWGWPMGALSTLIFSLLFFQAHLYMQSLLQWYYVAMAGLGWWQWRYGGSCQRGVQVTQWPLSRHTQMMIAVLLLSGASWLYLTRYSDATHPFVDSVLTWASVVTTYMTAQKILENWLYWIVIDVVSAYLFFERGLPLTSALAVFYAVVALVGYFQWQRHFQAQSTMLCTETECVGEGCSAEDRRVVVLDQMG